jgi:hypothetical protein
MRRAVIGALLLTFSLVTPVAAAAVNETYLDAVSVSIGTTVSEDTTTADQTDPAETALNDFCGAPVVEHGVWFTFTASEDGTIALDTQDSDYSAGIMVFADDPPTAGGLLTCGPGRITVDVSSGSTYLIMVFGDGLTEATAGSLVFKVEATVPPPDVSLTVDHMASVDRFGVVRLTGTVTCTSTDGSGFVFDLFGTLRQQVGRLVISGFFDTFLELPCDGSTNAWEAFIVGDNGIFAGGKAATVAIAFACTDNCTEAFVEATVQLRRNLH